MADPIKIFHMLISIGSPELCHPNRGYAVKVVRAVYVTACTLPWADLRRALAVITWWHSGQVGGSTPEARYLAGSWASLNLVAYARSSVPSASNVRGP